MTIPLDQDKYVYFVNLTEKERMNEKQKKSFCKISRQKDINIPNKILPMDWFMKNI